jgi:hypothetical protein
MACEAQAKNIVFKVWRRLPDSCPCTHVLMWLEPGTIFCGVVILTFFAWFLSFPSWG